MSIELLALDLDGTTLNNDHLTVSQQNAAALRAAMDKGVLLVPATGRARGRLPEFLQTLSGIRYLITSNGAKLTELATGKTLYENTLPRDTVEPLFRELEKLPLYIELYADGNCYTDESRDPYFKALPLPYQRRTMMSKNRICLPDLFGFFREQNLAVEKLNLPFLLPEQREPVHKILDAVSGITVTSSLAQNAEINAASCNKGSALAFLCRHLGIPAENVMALGDNGNDVALLQFAGIAAVPSNAADCAKAVSRVFPVSNEENFAAMAIQEFILGG